MAIRLSTIANRLITMMNAVIGPCVVAARNPTMPMAICGIATSAETPVGCATRDCRLSGNCVKDCSWPGADRDVALPNGGCSHIAVSETSNSGLYRVAADQPRERSTGT